MRSEPSPYPQTMSSNMVPNTMPRPQTIEGVRGLSGGLFCKGTNPAHKDSAFMT